MAIYFNNNVDPDLTLRQQGLQNVIGGLGDMEAQSARDKATQRQQALQALQFQQEQAKQGIVLTPEQQTAVGESFKTGDFGGLGSIMNANAENVKALREQKARQEAEDRKLNRQYKSAQVNSLNSKAGADGKGQKLSAKDVMTVQEGQQIPTMLKDVQSVIGLNKDMFGPVAGRIASMNPYDEKAQTIDSQVRAASQAFGRYMEGGVLRKEDEEKYRKMFPNLSDTPEVAANKLAVVDRLLSERQKGNLSALSKSGYDVSAFDQSGQTPSLPSIITGGGNPQQQGQPASSLASVGMPSGTDVYQRQGPDLMQKAVDVGASQMGIGSAYANDNMQILAPEKEQRRLELMKKAGLI